MRLRSVLRAGVAALIGPGRRGADAADMLALREETWASVLPIRVIFLEARSVRGRLGDLKGGFWRPRRDAMRNFWLEGGIERAEATRSERSDMVASCGKERVCCSPWWWSVSASWLLGVAVSSAMMG